jgi:hypothetical protein
VQVCYFCLEPLAGRPHDKHHKLPKRYLTTPEKRDKTNLALSHCECHQIFHRIWDNVKLNRVQYVRYMQSLNWAEGIFTPEDTQAAAD